MRRPSPRPAHQAPRSPCAILTSSAPAVLTTSALILVPRGTVLEAHAPQPAKQAIMSVILDGALPPPHLLQSRSASWTYPYSPYEHPAQVSSPPSMSPRSVRSYMSRIPESPLPPQDLTNMPTSAWYSPSVSAPASHNEVSPTRSHHDIHSRVHCQPTYAGYPHFVSPHPSSVALSPPTPNFHYIGKPSTSSTQLESSIPAPSSSTGHARDTVVSESTRLSEEPHANPKAAIDQSSTVWRPTTHLMERPPSSSSSMHSGTVDTSWSINSIGLHTTNLHHDQFYSTFQPITQSPRVAESVVEVPSNHNTSPQSRRMYTSIAPLPLEIPRSNTTLKRNREDEDEAEYDTRPRKRSDSSTSAQLELSDEDRLLLKLKEEESMPWKDIAARFQTDLGKCYQIPALQMRLKRLRERMRVWTEADVRALRMAHEYWNQNKFDIISQKVRQSDRCTDLIAILMKPRC